MRKTAPDAPAVVLYESCGFRPFGRESLAVGSQYVTKLHLWRRLEPDGRA